MKCTTCRGTNQLLVVVVNLLSLFLKIELDLTFIEFRARDAMLIMQYTLSM